MKPLLSKRVMSIKPSPTLQMSSIARRLASQGIDVVDFGVGEPDFDTPSNIKDAGIKAIEEGFTKYTDVGGIPELKDAICEKFRRDNSLEYSPSQILVSCGAKHSLYNLFQALVEEGDEVIISSPYWVSYLDMVYLAGADPKVIPTRQEDGFKINPRDLEKTITPQTKALVINSPSNPTGAAYEKKEMEEIARIALKNRVYIISDEVYEKFCYDGFEAASIASLGEEIKRNTIVINGVSKTYCMTGWRIGYTAASDEIISAMAKIQSQSTSNPTSISQKAAIAALKSDYQEVEQMVRAFEKRRSYMVDKLLAIEGVTCFKPKGAFYVFPNLSYYYRFPYNGKPIENSSGLSAYFLEEAKVSIVPGVAFGDDNHCRLSYATSFDRIEEGLKRISNALSKLTSS